MRLFLCGDVMTGRGIDQILPRPSEPTLHEPYGTDARGYVELAEAASGPIPRSVEPSYVWGVALAELERVAPHVRLVNLETSITSSDDAWPGKGIHYRMHPANLAVLTAARLDLCTLANNHVLDWGYAGLAETLESLERAGLAHAGVGRERTAAEGPAVLDVPGAGRLLVVSLGAGSSGVPEAWAAAADRPGVWRFDEADEAVARRVGERLEAVRRPGDRVVASVHWGGNWGTRVPAARRRLAHRLIEAAGVDVVHGHSSHHVQGIELHRERLILYGCGDFLNDYEGIGGHAEHRPELGLMYFPELAQDGALVSLEMVPTRLRRFRIERPSAVDVRWLRDRLEALGRELGTRARLVAEERLRLEPRGGVQGC